MIPRTAVHSLFAAACALFILCPSARAAGAPADTMALAPADSSFVPTPSKQSAPAGPPAAPADPSRRRPRIGLVLSGGGARGAAHIGLLQVLEQHRIPVDLIAATSMGALVGGLYASGLTPAALDSVVTGLDWADAFNDKIRRADRTFCRKRDDDLLLMKKQPGLRGKSLLLPPSMLDTHRIDLLLRRLSLPVVAAHNFDELGIPFRAVAADLVTGEPVVLDHGDLAQAMRASMSIPGAFAPLTIDGRLLVDGGIADNLPIDVARAMGADVLIVVDVAPPPKRREDLNSLPAITFQLTILASEQNRRRQIDALGRRDVYIAPELGTMTMASFDRAANAIEMGRQAAEAAMPALEPLALSPAEYDAHRAARAARIPAPDSLLIADVRIENQTRVSDAVFANRLDVQPGRLDVEHLEHGLDRLCGLELFESIGYDIQPGPTGDTLTVTPTPRTWGPNYLQTGIAIFDDYQHPSFNLALAYTRMAVNPLNGEWSTGVQFGTESGGWFRFHQPLEPRLHWFVDVQPSLISWPIPIFDGDGHKLSEYRVFQYGAAVAGGREIGEWGEVRAGVLRQGGTLQLSVGDPEPSSAIDTGELFVRAYADELDAVAFPRRGFLVRARASAGIEALGSAASYQQLSGDGFIVQSHRDLTVQLGGIIGITADSDAPIESQFRLGGLGRLSGLEQDERIGQQAALVRGMVYRRMSDIYPMYLGLSAEYGNTFETRADLGFDNAIAAAALFLGAETPFGPAVVGYGRADSGRYNFYLTLNRIIGGPRPSFRLR